MKAPTVIALIPSTLVWISYLVGLMTDNLFVLLIGFIVGGALNVLYLSGTLTLFLVGRRDPTADKPAPAVFWIALLTLVMQILFIVTMGKGRVPN